MKQPFSYYGGKQKLAPRLAKLIPVHSVYVEPFCGGASLFFAKQPSKVEVLNDYNKLVVNFFEVLRDQGDELCRMLSVTPYSEKIHADAKKYAGDDKLLMAYYFFVNVNMSFGYILDGGWGRSDKRVINAFVNKVDRLPYFIQRVRDLYLACTGALQVIKQFDSESTFIYCDPPYPNTAQGHYSGYTQADFDALVATLQSSGCSFMLSCYSHTQAPFDYFDLDTKIGMHAADGSLNTRTERIYYRGIDSDKIMSAFPNAITGGTP